MYSNMQAGLQYIITFAITLKLKGVHIKKIKILKRVRKQSQWHGANITGMLTRKFIGNTANNYLQTI